LPAPSPTTALAAGDGSRPDDPSAYPWRAICHLSIHAGDGSKVEGTGWLAAPRLIVTAGHCVYQRFRGGWAESIEVAPGRDGARRPFGPFRVDRSGLRSVQGWTRRHDPDFDYGGIVLPPSADLAAPGDEAGYFGFGAPSDSELLRALLNLAGYPDGVEEGTLWWHARGLDRVEAGVLRYGIDTRDGQSGGPVWLRVDGGPQVVGIHSGERVSGGQAVRINRSVYDNLVRWQREAS
jgi:V8-like Glu-specific endopeptidase